MREREKESVSYKKTRQIASSLAGFHCVCVSKILNDLIDSFRYMVFKRDLVQYKELRLHLCVCNNSKNSIFILRYYYILYCLVFIVVSLSYLPVFLVIALRIRHVGKASFPPCKAKTFTILLCFFLSYRHRQTDSQADKHIVHVYRYLYALAFCFFRLGSF